jgi:hypothetical protein
VLDRAMLPLDPSERRTPESVERIEESQQVILPFPDRVSVVARGGS